MTTQAEREQFETWARGNGGFFLFDKDDEGAYKKVTTFWAWVGWQACAAASEQEAKDAARYRWLRRHSVCWNFDADHWRTSEAMDAAIDAAMGAGDE